MGKTATEAGAAESANRISTQASTVYDRLQDDILTGQLKPDRKLRLKELIEIYDTGNSPLREALNRLSANGLVVREETVASAYPPRTPKNCWS